MTEAEKRYKILKKRNYEQLISKEEKRSSFHSFMFGLCLLATVCAVTNVTRYNADTELSTRIIGMILGMIDTTYAAYNLKEMIKSVSKKTTLESKIEDINTELAIQDINDDVNIKNR